MNSTFNKVFRCGVWTVQCDIVSDDDVMTEVIAKKRVELDGDNKYHMTINLKGNKVCPDLERSIFVLQDGKGEIVNGIVNPITGFPLSSVWVPCGFPLGSLWIPSQKVGSLY